MEDRVSLSSRKESLSLHLAKWLGVERTRPYSLNRFKRILKRIAREHGIHRNELLLDQDSLAIWLVRLYLQMTGITYERLCTPAPEPNSDHLAAFEKLITQAPTPTEEFHQSRIDSRSACRRAHAVHKRLGGKGNVLFLGDDDGCSLALSCLGDYRITALDIDQRILDWLKLSVPEIELHCADIRQIPDVLRGAFDAVVTDPVRDTFGLHFLEAARDTLEPGGWLFLADHPDWNPKSRYFLAKLSRWGFESEELLENWHAYSATLPFTDEEKDSDMEWFVELSHQIQLWSHLYILRSPGVSFR